MGSKALGKWQNERKDELDQLLSAHTKVGGAGPGRRYTTEQLNFAYLVAVSAQFQGFCRDLHTEAVGAFAGAAPHSLQAILIATLTTNRRLDQGNANSSAIAEDFGRIGVSSFWEYVAGVGGVVRTKARQKRLEQMNRWRNAIAHNNFEQYQSKVQELDGHLRPRLEEVRKCRSACNQLAEQLDAAIAGFLGQVVGSRPW